MPKLQHAIIAVLAAGLLPMLLAQEEKPGWKPLRRIEPTSPSRELTTTVEELEALSYPPLARAGHASGRVVVRVNLGDTGYVTSVAMPKLNVPHTPLADAAVSNVRRWRFKPNPQKEALVVYDFSIDETCADLAIKQEEPSVFRFQAPNHVTITACPYQVQP